MNPNQISFLVAVSLVFLGHSEARTESITRCPSTIFKSVASSEGTVDVTWDQPDCGADPHSTHINGDAFPQGVHTVIFWFQADQRRRCCSFDIVVSGPDFNLCTQNQCFLDEICEPGLDHYYCYKDDLIIRNCPSLVVIRKEGDETPVANWVEPTAYDYIGREIQPSSREVSVGDDLTLGEHTFSIMYSYTIPTTGSPVSDFCRFRVMVAEGTGPGILSCPRDITVVSSQSSVQVDWLEPQLQPNENASAITMSQTHSPGQMFTVPSQVTVTYEYTLMSNQKTTTCSFVVQTFTSQDTRATLLPSKSSEKFFVIPNTERDTKVWRRPSLFTTGVVGPVVVFPSRVQPQGSGYAKGFYPVTYTFQDTEGNILETDEFVVVYQSDSADDVTINCNPTTRDLTSETQLPATWSDPVTVTGDDRELVWIEQSHSPPVDVAVGESIAVSYMVYRTDNLVPVACVVNVAVRDNVPPVVSNCPGNMVYMAFQGTTETTVPFTEPTATDGCGEVTVESTPASGSPVTLSLRETVNVEYRFTDCSGNLARCQFSVTLTARPNPFIVVDNCKEQVISTNDTNIAFPIERYPTLQYNDQEVQATSILASLSSNTKTLVSAIFILLDSNLQCFFNVTVLDMIPPLVENCDQRVTVRPVERGVRYMVVNWTEPSSVMDLSGGELVYQSHFPMQPLPVGETTEVQYIFKDEVDLETTCTVLITVEEAPPIPPCAEPNTRIPCSVDNQQEAAAVAFSFTNDIIITIVITAVATFVVCVLGFLVCICCCTCCCTVETKADTPPLPRGATHRAGRTTEDTDSPDQERSGSRSRFVIKLPGIGKVPIYGQVEALSSAGAAPSHQTVEETLNVDETDWNPGGRSGNQEYSNEAFQFTPDTELGNGTLRVVDTTNDGVVYGYDEPPQQVARPAPLPPVKPRLPPKPPTNDFLQMQIDMKNKRESRINGYVTREINDSDIYGFDTPS